MTGQRCCPALGVRPLCCTEQSMVLSPTLSFITLELILHATLNQCLMCSPSFGLAVRSLLFNIDYTELGRWSTLCRVQQTQHSDAKLEPSCYVSIKQVHDARHPRCFLCVLLLFKSDSDGPLGHFLGSVLINTGCIMVLNLCERMALQLGITSDTMACR